MGARRELPKVGEIKILGDEKTTAGLGGLPDIRVRTPDQSFTPHGVHRVASAQRTEKWPVHTPGLETDASASMEFVDPRVPLRRPTKVRRKSPTTPADKIRSRTLAMSSG